MNWLMHNKLVFILIILVVAGGVWYGLSQSSAPPPLLSTTTADGSPVSQQASSDQEIIGTLLSLRAVTLSGTIFSDPSFATLQDFGTPIVPEPVGRPNPFAPLGAQNVQRAATSTGGTQSLPARPR